MREFYNAFAENAARYNPANDPSCKSREDVIEWLWQWSPFNMTDGTWLRNIDRAGPMDEVRSLLFSILTDEMGNGVVWKNHPNIARDMFHALGIYPPPVDSRDFVFDDTLMDSSFTVPTFELAISQFSERYYPEIIGMTLFLEWNVLDLKPTVELLKYYDIDPHFYVMHIGIDNAAQGHGWRALQATKLYLDKVRSAGGEHAVQAQWRRIWNGYVAFGTTGTFGKDLNSKFEKRRTPEDRMIEMIRRKAPYGSLNHGVKMIGENLINDWFSDPKGFLKALCESDWVVPGEPEKSALFDLFDFEKGRMYHVFTPEEIELWREWIRWLTHKPLPVETDPAENMAQVIRHLKLRQTDEVEHRLVTFSGPGTDEPKSVAWWFTQPVRNFMAALADPENKWIVPGQPDQSPFITRLLSPTNNMGKAFASVIPGTGDLTAREIVQTWIAKGCPLPPSVGPIRHLWHKSPPEVRKNHPTGVILGMGGIH